MNDEWNNDDNGLEPRPSQEKTHIAAIGKTRFKVSSDEVAEFESARRYIMAAQVIAIISLFIGGMLLSGVALICAIFAYGKLDRLAQRRDDEPEAQRALKRSGIIVIAIAGSALVVNAIAVAVLYPMLANNLQAGNLGSLTTSAPSTIGGSSTWG